MFLPWRKKQLTRLIANCQLVVHKAYQKFPAESLALAWTGGKDSTLLLWLVKNYAAKHNLPLPQIVFINEGDLFPEIVKFTKKLAQTWQFSYLTISNEDILAKCRKIGDTVPVKSLSDENQKELKRLKYPHSEFVFAPESFAGNHLLKTVPLNTFIKTHQIKAVMTGIRRDEHPARASETEFSKRTQPPHTRVHPILHLTESQVWQITKTFRLPYVNLYDQGYRSLGAKTTTEKTSQLPAWKQDLIRTQERGGRAQDKEGLMKSLRALGYM